MNNQNGGILRELAMKWAAPSGILITIGLVIWLIQLNANALRNAEAIGAMKAAQGAIVKELRDVGTALQRTAVLQESLYRQVDAIDEKMERLEIRSYTKDHDHDHDPNP